MVYLEYIKKFRNNKFYALAFFGSSNKTKQKNHSFRFSGKTIICSNVNK